MNLLIDSPIQRVQQVNLNYEYVISVALYWRFASAHRKPIKSAILATHPKFIHYAQMHALLTQGSTIDVRIFPDKRAAVAEWLGAPVELLAAESEPDIADEAASGAA
jgi:hypothetical protein